MSTSVSRKVWRVLKKGFLRAIVYGAIAAVALAIALPFWFGFALRMTLPDELITFESYSRSGYGRFILEGVSLESPQATVAIDKLEAYSPLVWPMGSISRVGRSPLCEYWVR